MITEKRKTVRKIKYLLLVKKKIMNNNAVISEVNKTALLSLLKIFPGIPVNI